MSSRDRSRDDDLEERLDELEDVLSELRRDLRRDERDRRGPPRPPRISELLRFTEQYTIPTVIALLEATIKSLKLVQGSLRLADPTRGLDADAAGDATADRLAGVRDEASAGLARSLAELRTALSEADLPEDAASRSIVADARDLTAEIEARIEEGRREVDAHRDRGRDGRREASSRADRSENAADGAVHIDVTDPDDAASQTDATGGDGADVDEDSTNGDDAPEVDVESELESIKRQIDGTGGDDDGDGRDGDDGGGRDGDDGDDTGRDGDDGDDTGRDGNGSDGSDVGDDDS
ncbi:hypothetical protein [Halorubrum sp. JWXQ-INN 858]|uniref:DUF7547 family protein n=1 Tax=Halorubrum sp. JWXQ-INN 858 TaxID=2690782 RepID=UPI00190F1719|nr:hypothetical protein [Halorubrum sp. JWXQ-INN 858]